MTASVRKKEGLKFTDIRFQLSKAEKSKIKVNGEEQEEGENKDRSRVKEKKVLDLMYSTATIVTLCRISDSC